MKRDKDKLTMNFIEEWCYKEAVLDAYDDFGLELTEDEVMEYYHHLLKRIDKRSRDETIC